MRFVRIDNRLVHGQVIETWLPHTRAGMIVVVNDELSGNMLRQEIMSLAIPDGVEIRPYTAGFGAMTTGRRDDPTDRPHIGVTLMRPQSRGSVRIVSPDPDADPVIEQRYDSAPADVELLRAGTRLASELAGTTVQSEEIWSTSQHLCGTAKMGAVVDGQCRVYGLQNLWVVDGSILPEIQSRGPHATIVMAGHRAPVLAVADDVVTVRSGGGGHR